jgi:hypothetical protein
VKEETKYALLGISVTLLLAGVGALWKAATFRGDMYQKWKARVDVTIAGLSERAVTQLLTLQQKITDLLGGSREGEFDPLTVVVDPSELSEPVSQFQLIIAVRDRLESRFRRLLKLGRIFIAATGLYIIGLVATTVYVVEFTRNRWIGLVGGAVFLVGVLGMVLAAIAFVYFQQRLSSAEILSEEDG